MNDKFDDFVKKQVQDAEKKGGALDLKQELSIWRGNLQKLYQLVNESLAAYTADGSIKIEFAPLGLTEEALGPYQVEEGIITIGLQVVRLTPVGTFLIGARGRVDMKGPRGSVVFLVVPPKSKGIEVRVSVTIVGQGADKDDPPAARVPPELWIWKIAARSSPRVAYVDLTHDSFLEALMGVVNG